MREARNRIHDFVKQGGVRPAAPAEKSTLMVGLDLFTGKAVITDVLKKEEEVPAHSSATILPKAPGAPGAGTR